MFKVSAGDINSTFIKSNLIFYMMVLVGQYTHCVTGWFQSLNIYIVRNNTALEEKIVDLRVRRIY